MKTLADIKMYAAVGALVSNGLNQSKAAKQLDISRGTLRRLVSGYVDTEANDDLLNEKVLNKHLSERG